MSKFGHRWVTAAMASLLVACVSVPKTESPYLSVAAIKLVRATPLEQRYRISVRVQNPNDHDLKVTGLNYELRLNDRSFLRGVSDTTFTVPRFGEYMVEVYGISTLFGFMRQLQAAGAAAELSYALSGKLSLQDRMLGLPFSYAGQLSLPGDIGREGLERIPAPADSL